MTNMNELKANRFQTHARCCIVHAITEIFMMERSWPYASISREVLSAAQAGLARKRLDEMNYRLVMEGKGLSSFVAAELQMFAKGSIALFDVGLDVDSTYDYHEDPYYKRLLEIADAAPTLTRVELIRRTIEEQR